MATLLLVNPRLYDFSPRVFLLSRLALSALENRHKIHDVLDEIKHMNSWNERRACPMWKEKAHHKENGDVRTYV